MKATATLPALLGVPLLLTFTLSAAAVGAESDAAWKPAAGPLLTRWAKDVSPDNVLPEYPRPQMVRKDWLNLNGLWDYAIRPKDEPKPQSFDGRILVPFCPESALSGVMKMVGEKNRLWYRRTFTVPKGGGWDEKDRRVLLHFGAVDWEATVWVNGREFGSHRGGYDPFDFDITDALKKDGGEHAEQEIVVSVFDPTDAGTQPRGKQVRKPGGIFYTPCTGIWQTVWTEPVPMAHVDRFIITPDVDHEQVTIAAVGTLPSTNGPPRMPLVILDDGKEVAHGEINQPIGIPRPHLWSPEDPHLYTFHSVPPTVPFENYEPLEGYFAMRKTSLGKDDKGITRMMLNNKFVMQVGPLDQGFWPDGIYTAPTDAALKYDIEITKKLGFNMTRKHVKVEPQRWYYWCDKLGLMVWQDMPSGDKGIRSNQEDMTRSKESAEEYEAEWKHIIDANRNHPCIVMWVPFNEGWGQFDTARIVEMTKKEDPTRLVDNASGWTDRGVGDVHDMHNYPGPGMNKPEENRASVLGEFGGLGLRVEGHSWAEKSWGYRGMADANELTSRYVSLLRRVWALKDEGLSACVYTQITDVETECNGLLTYDREVIKPDLEKVAAANRGELKPAEVLVPTALMVAQTWRYTFEKPEGEWTKGGYDDSKWQQGEAGFGTKQTPGAMVRTTWDTHDVWLRREFTIGENVPVNPQLLLHHDDDAEVYLNGELAFKEGGYLRDYQQFPIRPEAKAALKPGKNVVAVHCHQNNGGQYIDVGIVDEK